MRSRADLNSIRGFLVPVYSDDEIPGRETRHALTPVDFRKVAEGYACPGCLADFGTYRPVCPVCGHERDIYRDIVRAYDWEQHERDRKQAEENPTQRPSAPPMHVMVERAMREHRS